MTQQFHSQKLSHMPQEPVEECYCSFVYDSKRRKTNEMVLDRMHKQIIIYS